MNRKSPNSDRIGCDLRVTPLETPALIIDQDMLDHNLGLVQHFVGAAGIQLRPHAKSHKTFELARRQIELGAIGICVATVREAEAFADPDLREILLTTPIASGSKAGRFVSLGRPGLQMMAVVDHPDQVMAFAGAASAAGTCVDLLVDVDIGMGRTGARTTEDALSLCALIETQVGVRYRGVQAYSGAVQHIPDLAMRRSVYLSQLLRLRETIAALSAAGRAPEIVSGGGTGTLAIDAEMGVLTESQAGSYPLMDVQYKSVEVFPALGELALEPALRLRASVTSVNQAGYVTIDAGFKSLATDGPLAEPIDPKQAARTRFSFFGDEHGKLEDPMGHFRRTCQIDLITPHCDPTVNLHDWIHIVKGGRLVDIWPIVGRGSL